MPIFLDMASPLRSKAKPAASVTSAVIKKSPMAFPALNLPSSLPDFFTSSFCLFSLEVPCCKAFYGKPLPALEIRPRPAIHKINTSNPAGVTLKKIGEGDNCWPSMTMVNIVITRVLPAPVATMLTEKGKARIFRNAKHVQRYKHQSLHSDAAQILPTAISILF